MKGKIGFVSKALAMSAWAALVVSGTVLADSDADILERIRPIGKVNVAEPAVAPAAAAPAPAPAEAVPAAAEVADVVPSVAEAAAPAAPAETVAAAPASGGASGQEIYEGACFVCHMTGISGAPKLGDEAAWEPRIAKGMDVLMQSVINGIAGTAMPPRGTCAACSDADLTVAVEYMVSQAQ